MKCWHVSAGLLSVLSDLIHLTTTRRHQRDITILALLYSSTVICWPFFFYFCFFLENSFASKPTYASPFVKINQFSFKVDFIYRAMIRLHRVSCRCVWSFIGEKNWFGGFFPTCNNKTVAMWSICCFRESSSIVYSLDTFPGNYCNADRKMWVG